MALRLRDGTDLGEAGLEDLAVAARALRASLTPDPHEGLPDQTGARTWTRCRSRELGEWGTGARFDWRWPPSAGGAHPG